jgi:hypothetical protein
LLPDAPDAILYVAKGMRKEKAGPNRVNRVVLRVERLLGWGTREAG